MSGTISFGGLVSGLDTNSLVDKLVAVEKLPITGYQKHQTDDNTKLTTLGSLISSAQALQTAAQALETTGKANPLSASSSDSAVGISSGSGATAGTHTIKVSHLAAAQVNSSTAFTADHPDGDGTLHLTVGSNAVVDIDYEATDSLETIATSINGKATGVVASVLYDGVGYRLMLTAKSTGLANGMSFTEDGSGLGFTALGSQLVDPADASFKLDGVPVTRASNHLTDVLSGVTLDLKGATPDGATGTTLTLGTDVAGLETKVQALVDAYNSLQKSISGQLTYSGTKPGTDTFFGDSVIEQLQRSVQGILSGSYPGGTSAATLGINLATNGDGTLTFDKAAFEKTLASAPSAAQDLFAGANGTPGLAQALSTLVTNYTRPVDGVLVTKQDEVKSDFKYWADKITQVNEAAAKLDARLRAQFLAMERALSLLNTQNSLLSYLGAGASATASSTSTGSSSSSSSSSSSTKSA